MLDQQKQFCFLDFIFLVVKSSVKMILSAGAQLIIVHIADKNLLIEDITSSVRFPTNSDEYVRDKCGISPNQENETRHLIAQSKPHNIHNLSLRLKITIFLLESVGTKSANPQPWLKSPNQLSCSTKTNTGNEQLSTRVQNPKHSSPEPKQQAQAVANKMQA